jgi:hypothetical protein
MHRDTSSSVNPIRNCAAPGMACMLHGYGTQNANERLRTLRPIQCSVVGVCAKRERGACGTRPRVGGRLGTHEAFASSDNTLQFTGAFHTLQHNGDLLGDFGLFVEDGLSLASESLLLCVVSPLPLGHQRVLPLLILRDLVVHMPVALSTMRAHFLWETDHRKRCSCSSRVLP